MTISLMLPIVGVMAHEAIYESYAIELKVINVFRGTNLGFELERKPTRVEGGVMFVRLLGGENEAIARNYEHPFTDVPDWADPYIGYLYYYSLTNGISSTEYGSTMEMKAKSYMTFVLRALGYDETLGDFTWDEALEYAFTLGILNQEFYTELSGYTFYRDQVAKLSYDALFFSLKQYQATLGEKLVSQGAISKVAAHSIGIIDDYYLNSAKPVSIYGLSLRSDLDEVILTMGQPNNILPSKLGYEWYIYNSDYTNYIQFGIKEDKVIAFYTTSFLMRTDQEITIGDNQEDALIAYTASVNIIEKKVEGDSTIYLYSPTKNDCETFITSDLNGYISMIYDTYKNNQIYAVYVVDKEFEESYIDNYLVEKNSLIESFNKQTLYITNAIRAINLLEPLLYEDKAALSATKHANDMVVRDYFSHISPDGLSPFDRMNNEGIYFSLAGENIAFGFYDAIHSVQAWYNSQTGHRENMLDDYIYMGVGIAFKDDSMYIVQNMWR